MVDSVQTLHAAELTGAAGSVGQVREVADRITRLAKARGIAVLLVGHVTKEGALAGPRVLEHLVDCVLQFEGERERTYRTLRALKNRFGSTNEVGVFEMRAGGLVEVADASARFVGEATRAPGSVVLAAMEGSRPLLVEVQALVSPVRARAAAPRRQRDRPQPARARARGARPPRAASASAAPTCSSTSPAACGSTSRAPTSRSRWPWRAPRAGVAARRRTARRSPASARSGLTGELRSVAHADRRARRGGASSASRRCSRPTAPADAARGRAGGAGVGPRGRLRPVPGLSLVYEPGIPVCEPFWWP